MHAYKYWMKTGTSYCSRAKEESKLSFEAQGQWKKDKLCGLAIRHYNATYSYHGQFNDDQRSGHGLEYIEDKLYYEGQFKDDARQGHGTEYNQNGSVLYVGQWFQGSRSVVMLLVRI